MASQNDNPELVDLLYEDELDEETADRLRAKIEETPEERAELESYEEMLSQIRDSEPTEEVPEGVHASIMDAAREAADSPAGDARPDASPEHTRTERREPSSSEPAKGIWTRISEGVTTSQLALTAVALLAAGGVLYLMQAQPTTRSDARSVKAAEQKPGTSSEEAPSEAAAELAETEQDDEEDKFANSPTPDEESEPSTTEKKSKPSRIRGESGTESKQRAAQAAEAPSRAEPTPSKEPTPESESSGEGGGAGGADESSDDGKAELALDDTDPFGDGFDSSGSSERGTSGDSTAKQERAADLRKGDEGGEKATGSKALAAESDEKTKETTKSAEAEKSKTAKKEASADGPSRADNAKVGDLAMGNSRATGDSKSKRAAPGDSQSDSGPSEAQEAPEGEQAGSETGSKFAAQKKKTAKKQNEKEKAKQDDVPSMSDVERAYDNKNWTQVIRRASAMLRTESIDESNRARVLELKAKALENQGKLEKAQTAFVTLRNEFPDYKPTMIEQAAERLRRKRIKSGDLEAGEDDPAGSPKDPQFMEDSAMDMEPSTSSQ